jgi:hypothetical protein
VWVLEELDLSSYSGQSVNIRFSFDTRDELYNGFRGWFLDDFQIVDLAASPQQAAVGASEKVQLNRSSRRGASESYWEVHKLPQTWGDETPTRSDQRQ